MNDATGPGLTDELLEDCLQALHRISAQGRAVEVGEIAEFARVTPSEAEAALSELRSRGLIGADYPTHIVLTDEGQKQAACILRRHRLSERLLTDVLGLPWDRVHEEAMRLEHALDAEAESRLESLLNHPETCPHGAPIPVLDGGRALPVTRPLDQVRVGTSVRISQIIEEDGALLRYLASLGLLPEARLTVEEAAPFGGPLLVRVAGARYALGREVAAKILVNGDSDERTGPVRARRRWRGGR
jgi:DtxR family transcriptional regulator, Mn-dependent transcriptional regulator